MAHHLLQKYQVGIERADRSRYAQQGEADVSRAEALVNIVGHHAQWPVDEYLHCLPLLLVTVTGQANILNVLIADGYLPYHVLSERRRSSTSPPATPTPPPRCASAAAVQKPSANKTAPAMMAASTAS